MKNLFEAPTVEEVKGRLAQLKPDSEQGVGQNESSAGSGALLRGNGDGDGGKETATHIHWAAAGALCEEVDDREREAHAAECGDGQELGGE